MNAALHDRLTQFHRVCQQEFALVAADVGQPLTPVMERLLRLWERIEIEGFMPSTRGLVGRPRIEHAALARAFVAKALLGLTQTSDLVERLNADGLLRRLCGFDLGVEHWRLQAVGYGDSAPLPGLYPRDPRQSRIEIVRDW
jgi:hypothetical protein